MKEYCRTPVQYIKYDHHTFSYKSLNRSDVKACRLQDKPEMLSPIMDAFFTHARNLILKRSSSFPEIRYPAQRF